MVRALKIPADQNELITEVHVEALEDYQAAVGGWIEPVDLQALGVTIYVNEEGLLRNLPLNSRASFLWWYFVPEARQKAMLVGAALVVGLPDRQGNSTDIPSEVAERLNRRGAWRVELKLSSEPDWLQIPATYTDYFEALVWAMVALERWTEAEDTRVVPVEKIGRSDALEAPPTAA
ncbi:DUF3846 domain-containing protein [uncultured Microbacterium sp.]|uniref:DUF3846 domain-containing protein n=1 Tax=uncultured Microbacterium sp. TaxID=191216 RepID=UPI0028EDCCE2|nr:DUF3846 domain-containing protein [uncultured Microbacterium sp.]